MHVTILGNNSALPAYDRHPTAQIVAMDGHELLLDCGEGTQIQMQRYGVRWARINRIFISHLHGDHYYGLFGLLTSMSLFGRAAPLHLHAPAPLWPVIEALLAVASTALSYELQFHPLPETAGMLVDEKAFSVSCFPTEHRIFCMGFVVTQKTRGRKILPDACAQHGIPVPYFEQLKAGHDYISAEGETVKNETVTVPGPPQKRYAYCADTVYTESFLPHIAGVDLLYHESTYLADNTAKATARFHSTAGQAALLAQRAGVKKLLLGHYSSSYQDVSAFETEAGQTFRPVEASVEGRTYSV